MIIDRADVLNRRIIFIEGANNLWLLTELTYWTGELYSSREPITYDYQLSKHIELKNNIHWESQ